MIKNLSEKIKTFLLALTNNSPKMARHSILAPTKSHRVEPHLCALGIMTKVPRPGRVKTRLSPPLTPDEAAELNKCFLRDMSRAISQARMGSSSRGVGVYTPPGEEAAYDEILPQDFFLLCQRGNKFGERLTFAAEDLFAVGFESVCLINSDSPMVPASSFATAANELAKPGDRLVLGPSDDGGYFLIGLKHVHHRLFEDIEWSTERVLEQTLQRAGEIGLEVYLLPIGFDVDDHETLQRLCQEVLGANASTDLAPNTRRFLAQIIEREGRDRICPML
jgi:rSAM/selenodomain-associated transferase 1